MSTDAFNSSLSANFQPNAQAFSSGGAIMLSANPVDALSSDSATITSVPMIGLQNATDLSAFSQAQAGKRSADEQCGQTSVGQPGRYRFVPQQSFYARFSGYGMNTSWGVSANTAATTSSQSTQSTEVQGGIPLVTYNSAGSQTTGTSTSGMTYLGPITNVGGTLDNLGQWLPALYYKEKAIFNPAECFSSQQLHSGSWTFHTDPALYGTQSGTGGLLGCAMAVWNLAWPNGPYAAPDTFAELWGLSYGNGARARYFYWPCLNLPQFESHPGYYQSWKEYWADTSNANWKSDIEVYEPTFLVPLDSVLDNSSALPSPANCKAGVAVDNGGSYVVNQSTSSTTVTSESISYSASGAIPISVAFNPFSFASSASFTASDSSTSAQVNAAESLTSFAWYNDQHLSNVGQHEYLCPTAGKPGIVTSAFKGLETPYLIANQDGLSNFIGSYEVCKRTQAGAPVQDITTDISACG